MSRGIKIRLTFILLLTIQKPEGLNISECLIYFAILQNKSMWEFHEYTSGSSQLWDGSFQKIALLMLPLPKLVGSDEKHEPKNVGHKPPGVNLVEHHSCDYGDQHEDKRHELLLHKTSQRTNYETLVAEVTRKILITIQVQHI